MSKLTQKDMLFTGLEPSSRIALIKQLEKALPHGKQLREQLAIGEKIEMEHTSDPKEARKIAMDHLKEMPDYYTRLKKMEKKGKSELGKAIDECMGMIDAELEDLEKAGAWGVPPRPPATPATAGGAMGGGQGTGGRGSERPGHKYIRREGQAGAYKYIYRDEQTGKEVEGGEPELQHLPHEKMEYGKQYHLADGTTVDWHGKNPAGQHIVGIHSGQPGGQAGQQLKLLHQDTQFRTTAEPEKSSEQIAKEGGIPSKELMKKEIAAEKPAEQKPKSQSTSTDFRKQMSGLTGIAYTKNHDIPDDVRHQAERVIEGIRNVADHLHKIKTPDEIGNMQSEMIEQFKKDISDSVDKKTMNEIFGESTEKPAEEKTRGTEPGKPVRQKTLRERLHEEMMNKPMEFKPAGQKPKFERYDNVEHDGKFWSVSKINTDGTFEISRATSPGESKSAAISKTVKAEDIKPWSYKKTKEEKTETTEKPTARMTDKELNSEWGRKQTTFDEVREFNVHIDKLPESIKLDKLPVTEVSGIELPESNPEGMPKDGMYLIKHKNTGEMILVDPSGYDYPRYALTLEGYRDRVKPAEKPVEKSVTQSLMHNVAGRMFYGLDPDSRRELEKALGGGTGQERPGHKYVRRQWNDTARRFEYIYKTPQGKEVVGPTPKSHKDWEWESTSQEQERIIGEREKKAKESKPSEKQSKEKQDLRWVAEALSHWQVDALSHWQNPKENPKPPVMSDELTSAINKHGIEKVLKEINNLKTSEGQKPISEKTYKEHSFMKRTEQSPAKKD